MLPIILIGAAVGAAMVSSNKSIAKQVIKKDPTLPVDPIKVDPIKVDPIKVDPIKVDPIKVTPIVGTKPTDLESIFTDIVSLEMESSLLIIHRFINQNQPLSSQKV